MKHNNTPIRGRVIGVLGTICILGTNLCQSQVAGTLNRNFNPSGLMVTADGSRVTGVNFFSGSLVVDLGGLEREMAIAINQNNGKIVAAFRTNTGPTQVGTQRLGIIVANQDGTLDTTFNPSGLSIDENGNPTAIGGYSGTLLLAKSRGLITPDVAINQSNGNILLAGSLQLTPNQFNRNLFLVMIKPDGTIDRTFNPSGVLVENDGTFDIGATYSGSLELSLRRNELNPDVIFDENRNKIVVAIDTEAPNAAGVFNAAVIIINPTGTNVLDRNFNPSGVLITSTGARQVVTDGGYSGALIIDLGASEENISVDLEQSSGKIVLAVDTATGPDMTGPLIVRNIGIIVVEPTGTRLLDTNFNPSGLSLDNDGTFVQAGGYSGTLLINLGGSEDLPSVVIDQDTRNIFCSCRTTTGPGPSDDLGMVSLTPTGALNSSFNPLAVQINATGSPIAGSVSGILLLSFGAGVDDDAAQIAQIGDQFIVTTLLDTGGATRRIGVVAANVSGAQVLNRGFNPAGLLFDMQGVEAPDASVYSGSLEGELVNGSLGVAMAIYQATGTIIAALQRGTPIDVQLFSFHSVTRFPPLPPLPPISELFQFGYIPMAAI